MEDFQSLSLGIVNFQSSITPPDSEQLKKVRALSLIGKEITLMAKPNMYYRIEEETELEHFHNQDVSPS